MGAAAALVSELHGELLRALSQHAGRHFEGLAQASRSFPTLSPRLRRRLRNLDTTFAYIRHVTKPLSDNFLSEVFDAVSTSVPVFASPSTSCSTTPSLATPSTSADACDADQVPRDEGQHPRAEDHQPREHPAPGDEHRDSTNLKMICESINLMSDALSAMNSTNANNFTMIKNAQMESRNFKVMNEMNKDHSARDQDHAGRIQGDLFLFLDRDFLGSVDSLQRFPKAALPGQLSDYFPQSLVLCRVQPQDRRYPWNLGRFPLYTRFVRGQRQPLHW